MFGGSALTLDIGVRNDTGVAVPVGSVLAVALANLADGSTADGFSADWPVLAAGTSNSYRSIVGVVLGPTGTTVPVGENCRIRVAGPCEARVTTAGAMALYDDLLMVNGLQLLTRSAPVDLDAAGTTVANAMEIRAVSLETTAGASADQVRSVWMRGPLGL
tara:strand:+ start:6496 stop:6978 length:483 start_codon:yes stop_codon:yes gene_type:complete